MPPRTTRLHYRWIAALVVLVALVLVVAGRGEERRFAEIARRAQPAWLFAALALQVFTYLVLAWLWSSILRRAGSEPPRLRSLAALALAELFADQTLPSGGIAGSVLVVNSLRRRGCGERAAMAVVGSTLLGFYAAQLTLTLAALAILLIRGRAFGLGHSVAAVALIVAVVMPVPAISILRGGVDKLPRFVRSSRAVHALQDAIAAAPMDLVFAPRALLHAGLARLAIFLLDAATLAVSLAAVGKATPFDEVLAAFVLASVVGSASFLPGGLGSFEVAATALLVSLGAPVEAAAPATLLMRGFSFWLPMLPGFLLARRELARASHGAR